MYQYCLWTEVKRVTVPRGQTVDTFTLFIANFNSHTERMRHKTRVHYAEAYV